MLPTRTVLLALFGALLLTGCSNEGVGPPVIGSFTCTPSDLVTGPGPVTFAWRVAGALSASIAPLVGSVNASNGNTTVQVAASTTFTLTATGLSGTTTATCPVVVNVPPVINSFTATPSTTAIGGGPVTLAWDVTGANMLSIDQGVGTVSPLTTGSKVVLVAVSTVFTLTATNDAGSVTKSAPVTVPTAAPTVNVTGTVVDDNGVPVSGETVLITATGGFSKSALSDANGVFNIQNVPTPYDATVIEATQAIQYQGLTRTDPSLTAFLTLADNRTATISGQLGGGTYPETAADSTVLLFSSPDTTDGLQVQSSGAYSSPVTWNGPVTTTGTLYALQIHNSGGLPADYPGYGTLGGVVLQDTQTLAGQNVTLSAVTPGTLSGTVTAPANYTVLSKSMSLELATDLTLTFLTDFSAGGTFSYVTPAIANTTLSVVAAATSAAGEYSARLQSGQSANASGVALDIQSAPTLTQPANGATGVTAGSTPFAWTQFTGGVYEFRASSATGPGLVVITAATTITLPDLSAAGLPLPASTNYSWFIVGLAPLATTDLFAAPGGINKLTVDLSESLSVTQTFTTAP